MQLQNSQADFIDSLQADDANIANIRPASHIQLHRNQIYTALNNALSANYPLIKQLLGDDFFYMTTKHFIQQYPSRNASLCHYGEFFSHFLAEYKPVRNLVFLPELASFEWSCHQVLYAAEHPAPASQLFHAHFPLLDIIDYCKKQQQPVELNQGGLYLLITRQQYDIKLTTLTEEDFYFQTSLAENT